MTKSWGPRPWGPPKDFKGGPRGLQPPKYQKKKGEKKEKKKEEKKKEKRKGKEKKRKREEKREEKCKNLGPRRNTLFYINILLLNLN